jgi:hypothetical protein
MHSKLVILTSLIGGFAISCGGAQEADPAASKPLAVVPNLTPTPTFSDSTVPVAGPGAGDLNPYGVAFVPTGFPQGGLLNPGDVIVANFNNRQNAQQTGNLQGTGTTITRVNNGADPSLFFTSSLIGLSTALGILQNRFVVVGNLPSTPTSPNTTLGMCNVLDQDTGPGALQIINSSGGIVTTLTDDTFLNGPWDLTVKDMGSHSLVFVSNVRSGTVSRIDLIILGSSVTVAGATQIASGYVHQCDPAAFVVGPTGLALDVNKDILYVSAAGDNQIFAVRNASTTMSDLGMGKPVIRNTGNLLHGPLGLALAPNGDLISAQGDAVNPNPDPNGQSLIVEFTPQGKFVSQITVEPMNAGSAFGLAVLPVGGGFEFAAVDDFSNQLDLWVVP